MNSSLSQQPIDAVITWVDGADPAHRQKLEAYLAQIGGSRPPSADPTRFNDAGEIDYCVASLLKFAPWVRTIFIVTDAQRPALLQKITDSAYVDRVKIVDHRDIFSGFEDSLPTFNSSSILSVLYRIPGLSERFLFLNDDFFIIRPVQPSDFFRGDKVVLRGSWHKLSELLWYKRLRKFAKEKFASAKQANKPKRVGFLAGQELTAKLLGFARRYFRLPHNPHAWRVSTHVNYFAEHPEVLAHNVKFRLRSAEQYIGESLAAHLELRQGTAIIDNRLKTVQIKPASQFVNELKTRLWWADVNANCAFMCVQSLERGSLEKQKIVVDWLDSRIGRLEDIVANPVK